MSRGRRNKDKLIKSLSAQEVPEWVQHFAGPFQAKPVEDVCQELFQNDFRITVSNWANTYMDNNMLSNIVIPVLRFNDGRAELDYSLLLGNPEDALRVGRLHPMKDEGNVPFESLNVVNTPDLEVWKSTRGGIVNAFLPKSELAKLVEAMDADAKSLVSSMNSRGPIIDIKDGVVDPFGKPLPETCPADSADVRERFSLEIVGEMGTPDVVEKLSRGVEFVNEVIEKVEDDAMRMENLMALMTAGHDTTAYTTQFCLFELARNPALQAEAREEVMRVLKETDGQLRYADLEKLDFLGRCITETLRLWNAAMMTFGRRTLSEEVVNGRDGKEVMIPAGTRFNFWFYGHHHSSTLWGDDSYVFNPHREFHEHEMQKGACPEEARVSAQTPCTQRFHPFSVPRRDCMGKNFAMIEMKLLLARILEQYSFELAGETANERDVAPEPSNAVYKRWCDGIAGTVQPGHIYLSISPTAARL